MVQTNSVASSLVLSSAPSAPPSSALISRYAVDIGNRYLKWLYQGIDPQSLPSVILPIDDFQEISGDEHSIVIESMGNRYVVGQLAVSLKGSATFTDDKISLAPALLLATLVPPKGSSNILIDTLAIAVPDSRQASQLNTKLVGGKSFTRNGTSISVQINTIKLFDEGYAAWKYATTHRLYQHLDRPNAILDLGGGTGIGRIFTPEGILDRASEVVLPGTVQLASMIGAALKPKLDFSPNLGLIMDAIADGSFQYGGTGMRFEGEFHKYRERWLTDIRQQLKAKWARQAEDVGQILIVGGSAPLAQSLHGHSRYIVASNPADPNFAQRINVYGLLEA